jgi:polysaccharide biosynthesis/export protein ExoF
MPCRLNSVGHRVIFIMRLLDERNFKMAKSKKHWGNQRSSSASASGVTLLSQAKPLLLADASRWETAKASNPSVAGQGYSIIAATSGRDGSSTGNARRSQPAARTQPPRSARRYVMAALGCGALFCTAYATGMFLNAAYATDLKLAKGGIDLNWREGKTGAVQPTLNIPFNKSALAATLDVSDRIRLKVYERDDLSGEYAVREDGSIMVPYLGRVAANGRTTLDLEQAITEKLLETTERTLNVSVEISQQRPVYVVGLVDKPGAYPYLRGMSVLQALAVSGGFQRTPGQLALALDASKESGVARLASEKLKSAIARQSRVAAEIKGATSIAMPARLLDISDKSEAQALIHIEAQVLAQRQGLRRAQFASIDREITSMTELLATMTEQRNQIERRVNTLDRDQEEIRGITRRGLATRQRVQSAERDVADGRGQLSTLVAQITRAERELSVLRGSKEARGLEQKAELELQFQTLSDEVRVLEQSIAHSSGLIRQIMGGQFGSLDRNVQQTGVFEIVRRQGDRATTIRVDELTTVLPGDVLRVSLADDVPRNRSGDEKVKASAEFERTTINSSLDKTSN